MEVTIEGNVITVVLPEYAEIFLVEESAEKLREWDFAGKSVVVNATEVKALDTAFLQLILSLKKTCAQAGAPFTMNQNDEVANMFALYGLNTEEGL